MLKVECYQEFQEGNYQLGKIEHDLENMKIGKNTIPTLGKRKIIWEMRKHMRHEGTTFGIKALGWSCRSDDVDWMTMGEWLLV